VSLKNCGPGSVVGIATGYGLDGPEIESRWGSKFSAPVQTGPGSHPASCTMSTGSFAGVRSGRGVTLTPHPLLVPWARKGRAKPLLPLWAVQPVQSLSACTRVNFTFTLPISHVDLFHLMVCLLKTVYFRRYWAVFPRCLLLFTRTLKIAVFEISLILYQSKGNLFVFSSDV